MSNQSKQQNNIENRLARAGEAAETALDTAIGGAALAFDSAASAVDSASQTLRDGQDRVRGEAEDAIEAVREAIEPEGIDGRVYEERTRDELYELAAQRDLPGRSTMNKDELIVALRAER